MPFPEFDPVAFAIGPLVVRWYALAYIVGLLGGWAYARRLAANSSLWGAQKQPSPEDLDDLLVYAALGVVLGGRLGYVLFYNPVFYLQNPLDALKIWQGGMAFHGGLAGAAAGIALLARRRGLNPLALFDVAATVAPIGIFLGRIANFINGELWGRASDLPWAVIFPRGGPEPRHPSQLYEAALEGLVLFFVLAWLARRDGFHRPGRLAGIFGMGYGAARIFVEFFREPDRQLGYLFGGFLTMGMVLSLPLVALGYWLWRRAGAPR